MFGIPLGLTRRCRGWLLGVIGFLVVGVSAVGRCQRARISFVGTIKIRRWGRPTKTHRTVT